MIKKNYTWYWNDGDATYTNKAYSLENIIEAIIKYYFHGETRFVFVDLRENDETGDKFHIHFVENDITHEYHIGTNPNDVAQFLADFAKECNRADTFEIEKI
jgi:hypothetical protein